MAQFPTLCSGAVAQYGSDQTRTYSTNVCRFVDGKEQRFPRYGISLKQWLIRLDQLNDDELSKLEDFFVQMSGPQGQFQFTDPWDGTQYPSCSFGQDSLSLEFHSVSRGRVTLSIKENRS
jgi:hypothetical protein